MNNSKKLILASSSEERMRMLTASGYKVDSIVPANIDESELKGEMPKALAFRLAFEKVQKVSQEFPNDVVIGADTVVSVGRTSLPKALLESDAKLCLDKLSGRRHVVYTGICLAHNSIFRKKVAMSIVKFKHLTEEEKSFYVESKEWYGKAGGYAIRGKASSFIQYIRGLDSTIMGLPMSIVYNLLQSFGIKPSN
ncbi:MAG: Maf family protein [Candidatus Lariskella arthropodorum]|uniref:Maf family protein n=1 Tax=Candidatus Lariskella endosymbiont of Epinotia ramella TaxID=3066224 RepID=UPI0030D42A85